jgi:hypothetical protein
MMYTTTFRVRGSMPFPLDMLRYDGCYPATPDAVTNITRKSASHWVGDNVTAEEIREQVEVELVMRHEGRHPQVTLARWSSFSWNVVPNSIQTRRS